MGETTTDLNSKALQLLNLNDVAFTAQITPDGKLSPIGGEAYKLSAALFERSFPRIHTVVVAKDQPMAMEGLLSDPRWPQVLADPHADFHVIRAATIVDAIQLLDVDIKTRWRSIDCALPPQQPDWVPRATLITAVQKFCATHASGYLVIVGGMGKGKSTFVAELLHDELARGHEPIFHIIDYHPSASGEPRHIAACLYDRLRRKHLFAEPPEWGAGAPERKLELLLKHLSATVLKDGQKEVLYVDAADQAEADTSKPLLPGALRVLPPGVLCVITSRANLEWLRTARGVTVWEMDDYIDDRADVRAYLRQRARQHFPALADDMVEKIVTQPAPPVFFTVAARIRQLQDQNLTAVQRQALLTTPDLWIVPPEELITSEALHVIAEAGTVGINEAAFWRTLGLLAVARAALHEEQLRAFGLWKEEETDRILTIAANFFRRRPLLRDPRVPYHFEHPGYHREVLRHVSQPEERTCHRQLAGGSVDWRRLDDDARAYCLQHRLQHLLALRGWQDVASAFADCEWVVERSQRFDFLDVYADALAATHATAQVPGWSEAFTAWERFLRWRIERLRSFPTAYWQEVVNEFVPQSPSAWQAVLTDVRLPSTSVPGIFLRKTTGPSTLTATGHTGTVESVAVSSDGQRVVSGSWDKSVKVWAATTGTLLADCVGHTNGVDSVALSRDGQRVVSGSGDRTVKVWDTASGRCLSTLFFSRTIDVVRFTTATTTQRKRGKQPPSKTASQTSRPQELVVVDEAGVVYRYEMEEGK